MWAMRRAAAAAALLLCAADATTAGPFARVARLRVGSSEIAVGVKAPADVLACRSGRVQHTVRRCELAAAALAAARCLDHRVKAATLNVHFQGEVVNMSVEFEPGVGFDLLLGDLRAALGAEPRVEYWADDDHLYASYIWVDGDAEIEITKTVKGSAPEGGVRAYVSSLKGNRPLSPDDAP